MKYFIGRRLISIAFSLITALLVLDFFFTHHNSEEMEKNKKLQHQTEEITVAISNIAIMVIHNLDLGIRSYALFQDEKYLYPYHIAIQKKDSILLVIEGALLEQQYPLTEFYMLRDSIDSFVQLNVKLKALIDDHQMKEFLTLANQGKGYTLWLQYEHFSDQVAAFETDIHARATANYEAAIRRNYVIQIVLFLICIPTLIFTTLHTNKAFDLEIRLREYESAKANLLRTQNEALEKKVSERTHELEEVNLALQQKNRQLLQQQNEIASQRDLLHAQNQKLNESQQIIIKQHAEIKCKNDQLELDVAHKRKEIVTYSQQLEQFAFAAAHNLRAPVARILGLGKILEYASGKQEEERFIIKSLLQSTHNLDEVIRDLNMILETKTNVNLQLSEVYFRDELNVVKSHLKKDIQETQCEIIEHFEEAPTINTVRTYLDSILFNLLSNAIKYRSPDRKAQIILKSFHADDFICLEVQDNGLGIDLERFGQDIFGMFKRFHTHTEGKGLGLYLIKLQAMALGGKVEISSVPDQGSVFRVYFKDNQNTPAKESSNPRNPT